ncbi:MAG: radical SAM protein, partial [Candidatus Thermoplasmatota archaeon]|nr:radical SAM protein [Candidatus Thermoplasmatota archaeon]
MKIRKTRSICPTCLKEIPADIINHNDKIYIEKKCKNHGKFKAIHYFDNPLVYESMHNIIKDSETGNPDGMVIDITLNCNMGCPFCFAKTDRRTMDEPSIDTILSKIKGFKGSSIYLCGGEPTTREDLEEIISKIKEKGKNIVLFTNGLKLADKEYLKRL